MISAIPPRMMHFNLLQLLPFHKWRHSTPSLDGSPPMQWTPTYTTRYSAPLTMVTNPPRTQTFWLWYTNSRPSKSIAAIPRKVPSTLLLTPNDAINCTPADLLSVLSTAYKQWTSLHPGEGVLMCSLTDERVALRPFPISWLYHVDTAAPPPPFFGRLADVFSAGTEQYRSPIFDGPISLGPAASLHLNPALLDPPHLDQSCVLEINTSIEFLSWGAIQYHYTFYEGGPRYSLLSLTPDTHPPPDTYLQDLLDLPLIRSFSSQIVPSLETTPLL